MPERDDAREQRWTLHFAVEDPPGGGVLNAIISGPTIGPRDPVVEVVPAARLAELELENDELSAAVGHREEVIEHRELALERAREALDKAGIRLAQCKRDRGERDKVLAQAQTGMREVAAALDALPSSPNKERTP